MVKWAWVVWSALAGALAVGGCGSSSGSSDGPPSGTGFEQAGSAPVPECSEGAACDCEDGRRGATECAPKKTCSCDACPAFVPDTVPEFESCFGDVIGDWALESAELKSEPLQFLNPSLQQVGMCPAQIVADGTDMRFNLSIPSAGSSRLFMSALPALQRFLSSCSQPLIGAECSQTAVAGQRCSDAGCGICSCGVGWDRLEDESVKLDLTTELLSLSTGVSSTDKLIASFDFCRADKHLTLNYHGLRLTLRKVQFSGVPAICSDRATQASCEVGDGCDWINGYCLGIASKSCSIGSYGGIPGCVLLEPGATCVNKGSPKPCAEQTKQACATFPGCQVAEGCTGPASDCVTLYQASGKCDESIGCTAVPPPVGCAGTTLCTDQKTDTTCKTDNGCTWNSGCTGKPVAPSCAEYDVTDCATHDGCVVEAG